ncbi:hypothetical protein ONO57_26915, partial [Salmonella enterica subsp. enterica serovar Anatum]|nr:hypothetical protein [Salmonella enterica subsp. enterica serovar Anatum]
SELKAILTHFSGFPRGKHLFLRCLRQNRVQRVLAVRARAFMLSSPSCRGNFHFQHYKDAECQYTNLFIKDGEDIPLCIVIRQD